MTTKSEKDRTKQIQDKCQSLLAALLRDEDNKYCVDCDSKGPRWASWNLGVFLCIRCAGIHRNLGVHISKVKSVNLDAWTPEQVVSLQQMGNSRARAVYEANLPDNFRRPQNDSSLESFIRAKYEHKKYIAREWVPPPLPKVNWEKEIDEEIERQKRKKKTSLEKKSVNMEVPQLPKPKSASPKPGRVTQPVGSGEAKQNADLLGLQNNAEDSFSNFVSATTTAVDDNKKAETYSLKSEEESFFNQITPTEKEKVKLTKDNILALYGNTPTVNNFNPAYQQQGFQNFAGYPPPNLPSQNGVTQFNVSNQFQQFSAQFPYQQQPVGNVGQFIANSQFQGSNSVQPQQNMQFSSLPATFPQNNAMTNGRAHVYNTSMHFQTVPNSLGSISQFPTQGAGFTGQIPSVNPFFGNNQGANVQQQFANMSLTNKTANTGPTLATNIWQ